MDPFWATRDQEDYNLWRAIHKPAEDKNMNFIGHDYDLLLTVI
jgi:hypothetical protein